MVAQGVVRPANGWHAIRPTSACLTIVLQLTAKEDALGGFTDLLDNSAALQQLGVAHGDMVGHRLLSRCP